MSSLFSGYNAMINAYSSAMNSVMSAMIYMSSHYSYMNPGNFLMLQFMMGEISQTGEAISNMMSTVNSMLSRVVGNYKGG